MKYLTDGTQKGFDWGVKAWRRRLLVFGVCNLLAFIITPQLFFGVWDTVGNVSSSMCHSRKIYYIRRTKGDTIANLVDCVDSYKSHGKAFSKAWSDSMSIFN